MAHTLLTIVHGLAGGRIDRAEKWEETVFVHRGGSLRSTGSLLTQADDQRGYDPWKSPECQQAIKYAKIINELGPGQDLTNQKIVS